jgi:hypothetical protein
MEEDIIIAELKDEPPVAPEPNIKVWVEGDGRYSFSSMLSPINTAKVISGLLNHILESDIGKR